MKRVLVIDHQDSFVFNLVEELQVLGAEVDVLRSDAPLDDVERRMSEIHYDLLLLSPGPGRPEEAGVMLPLLERHPDLPVLGVCLGMQAIVVHSGGAVSRAPELIHGQASSVKHDGSELFNGIQCPFQVGRYHSLFAEEVGPQLEILAMTEDGIPMVVRHTKLPRIGMQFHPESVLTPSGPRLLLNTVDELSSRAQEGVQ